MRVVERDDGPIQHFWKGVVSPFDLSNVAFPFLFTNRWLSRKERDAVREREDNLRRKKEEKKKERTVTIDLLGRRVIDDKPAVVDVYEEARLEEDRRAAEASAAAAEAMAGLFTRRFWQGRASLAGLQETAHELLICTFCMLCSRAGWRRGA